VLTEMGIGSSIVRKRVLRQVDLATAFWLNVFGAPRSRCCRQP